jgi:hypothetical protein
MVRLIVRWLARPASYEVQDGVPQELLRRISGLTVNTAKSKLRGRLFAFVTSAPRARLFQLFFPSVGNFGARIRGRALTDRWACH